MPKLKVNTVSSFTKKELDQLRLDYTIVNDIITAQLNFDKVRNKKIENSNRKDLKYRIERLLYSKNINAYWLNREEEIAELEIKEDLKTFNFIIWNALPELIENAVKYSKPSNKKEKRKIKISLLMNTLKIENKINNPNANSGKQGLESIIKFIKKNNTENHWIEMMDNGKSEKGEVYVIELIFKYV